MKWLFHGMMPMVIWIGVAFAVAFAFKAVGDTSMRSSTLSVLLGMFAAIAYARRG